MVDRKVKIPSQDLDKRIAELEARSARRKKKFGSAGDSDEDASTSPSKAAPLLDDVDRCDHLTIRSVLYHSVWSGELEKLRNGVLLNGQAWSVVCMALLLPCLGGGGTSTYFCSFVLSLVNFIFSL